MADIPLLMGYAGGSSRFCRKAASHQVGSYKALPLQKLFPAPTEALAPFAVLQRKAYLKKAFR